MAEWSGDLSIFFSSQIESLLYNHDVNNLIFKDLSNGIWKYKAIMMQLWCPPL